MFIKQNVDGYSRNETDNISVNYNTGSGLRKNKRKNSYVNGIYKKSFDSKLKSIFIPFYIFPRIYEQTDGNFDTTQPWNYLAQMAKEYSKVINFVAIINPNSGPGETVSASYLQGITHLVEAGVISVGYIYCSYGKVEVSDIVQKFRLYHNFYPGLISGVFIDEFPNSVDKIDYAREISEEIHNYDSSQIFSINPGTKIPKSFFQVCDIIVQIENSIENLGNYQVPVSSHAKGSVMVYNCLSTLDMKNSIRANLNLGYTAFYYSQDNLPHPWGSIPTYFNDMIKFIIYREM